MFGIDKKQNLQPEKGQRTERTGNKTNKSSHLKINKTGNLIPRSVHTCDATDH